MKLENANIEGSFENSLLLKYLENVVSNRPLEDVISNLSFRLQIFKDNGETQILNAIDRSKVDYLILATKLSTMIEVFDMLDNDNNIVMTDELQNEMKRAVKIISQKIDETKTELVNK